MTEQVTQIFTLEPQDNERLRSFCGAGDEHLSLIEKYFNLSIARRGFTFTLQSQAENPSAHVQHIVQSAVDLIRDLYAQTAPVRGQIKELDLEDVHIALVESRILNKMPNQPALKARCIAQRLKLSGA